MKVAIGSNNPAKYKAVLEALQQLDIACNWSSHEVDSGVRAQPISDEETVRGAIQRARNTLKESGADIAIGLEGGVVLDEGSKVMVCNWGALVDSEGNEFIAGGARIPLPDCFRDSIEQGVELGDLMEQYCNREGIRKHEGALGIFTNGTVSRVEMFKHVSLILIGQWQYKNHAKK
ncbi:DUF84 family protein [Bacillus tianshenii]|uniref:DUF84 family protein n=1 Tax=Sutcliffiella tianshenii TaxID=1463404 RepID=UPI00195B2B98